MREDQEKEQYLEDLDEELDNSVYHFPATEEWEEHFVIENREDPEMFVRLRKEEVLTLYKAVFNKLGGVE